MANSNVNNSDLLGSDYNYTNYSNNTNTNNNNNTNPPNNNNNNRHMVPPNASNHIIQQQNSEDHSIGAYYSLLPDRNSTFKERWKYWWRRSVFYVLILAFVGSVVTWEWIVQDMSTWFWLLHTLWFDLDVTVSKNNVSLTRKNAQRFIRFFHGVAFGGSFVAAGFGSMIITFRPQFIHDRARDNEEAVALMWTIHCVATYLPVVLHLADLRLNKGQLRKREHFTFRKPLNSSSPISSSVSNQVLRVIWMVSSPILLVVIWIQTGTKPQYEVMYDNMWVMFPSLLVADVLSITLLIATLMRRKRPPP